MKTIIDDTSMVSVICPVYNTPPGLLKRAVMSVLNQDYSNIELILLDDCSTRVETIDCLDKVQTEHPDVITVVHSQYNRGISAERNQGIKLARGEWIAFLDHDDFYSTDFFKGMLEEADINTEMIIGRIHTVDREGNVVNSYPPQGRVFDSEWTYFSADVIWNRLYKREALINNNIWFPEGCYTEDTIFSIQTNSLLNNVKFSGAGGYMNFLNPESASHNKSFLRLDHTQVPLDQIDYFLLDKRYNDWKINAIITRECSLLACMNCAGSSKTEKKIIIKRTARQIRDLRGALSDYLRFESCSYDNNVRKRIIVSGYIASCALRLERIYTFFIHALIWQFYKAR